MSGALAVGDLSPLTHRSQREYRHDGHPAGAQDRTDEEADALVDVAVAIALNVHESEPDQSAGEPAEDDGHERDRAGGNGW